MKIPPEKIYYNNKSGNTAVYPVNYRKIPTFTERNFREARKLPEIPLNIFLKIIFLACFLPIHGGSGNRK